MTKSKNKKIKKENKMASPNKLIILEKVMSYICLLTILLVAASFRFDGRGGLEDMGEHLSFEALNIVEGYKFPLLGIHLSSGGFLGPLAYYLAALPLLISKNPLSIYILFALLSFVAVYLCYELGKKFFGIRVGLISALLFAISSVSISVSNRVYQPSFMPIFTVMLFYSLYSLIINKKSKHIILLLISIAFLTTFHFYAVLLVIVAVISILIFRPKIKFKHLMMGIIIFLLLNSPYIYFELTHNFENTIQIKRGLLLVWGSEPSNKKNNPAFLGNVKDIVTNFKWKYNNPSLMILLFIVSLFYLTGLIFLNIKNWKKNSKYIILLLWFIIPFSLLYISPENFAGYYCNIFIPVPYLIFGVFLSNSADFFFKNISHIYRKYRGYRKRGRERKRYGEPLKQIIMCLILILILIPFIPKEVPSIDIEGETDTKITKALINDFNMSQYTFMNNLHGAYVNTPGEGIRFIFHYFSNIGVIGISKEKKYIQKLSFYNTDNKEDKHYIFYRSISDLSEEANKVRNHYLILNDNEYSNDTTSLRNKKIEMYHILEYSPLINYSSFKYSFGYHPDWNKIGFDDSGWKDNISFVKWHLPIYSLQDNPGRVYIRGRMNVPKENKREILLIVTLPPRQHERNLSLYTKGDLILYINNEKVAAYEEDYINNMIRQKFDVSDLAPGENLIALETGRPYVDYLDIYEISKKE